LRHGARRRVAEEREVVAEDRLRHSELRVDVERGRRELDLAVLVEEPDGDVAGLLRDPVEAVDEVHVPRGASELPVGGNAQANLLLQPHSPADLLVLGRAQLRGIDLPGREVGSGAGEAARAEEAADVVGAERWARPDGHSFKSRAAFALRINGRTSSR